MHKTDFLIIGAGIAGLCTALQLKDSGKVTLISKGRVKQSSSYWAQGGIAAVLEGPDSFEDHINDTLKSGAYHNNENSVRYLVEHAPQAIRLLESYGVRFNNDPKKEAGHSFARVHHTSDFTGQDIMNQLIDLVKKVESIEILPELDVCELMIKSNRCMGAYARALNETEAKPIQAKFTILATGGVGQLYSRTSNSRSAGGDGIAMAIRAGVELSDIEFIQFHPTALNHQEEGRYFLLSETLRGAGAKLLNHERLSFLKDYGLADELESRDKLARAIYFEQEHGPVYLNLSHLSSVDLNENFPNIVKHLKSLKINYAKNPIPVTPVAHFICGGIKTDLEGKTSLSGLYALGEVACTGVHGANRLGSNALLEAVVFSTAVARSAIKHCSSDLALDDSEVLEKAPSIVVEDLQQVKVYAQRIGRIMWDYVSLIRSQSGLRKAAQEIDSIPARDYRIQNRQRVCRAIIQAALQREESVGCHYMVNEI